MEGASTAVTIAVTPPSSLTSPSSHPTPSYRIAMTSGASATATTAVPVKAARSTSVVNSLPEGLLAPPAQRTARLSLPPQLPEPSTVQRLASGARSSLPPPPPSPALRRRATILFYAIVAQFFLSIGCLFWVIATTITLLSFGLECSFGLGTSGVLALVVFAFLVVAAQLITSAMGIGAFNGKQQVEVKIYLLTSYLAINLVLVFIDAGLLFVCAVGATLSFTYQVDCDGKVKTNEYIALASFFLFFAFTILLHLIVSAGISLLLCWTNELFIQRSSHVAAPSATPTITTKEDHHVGAPAPPIKRFSQV